jgi:hypothetical protein
VIGRALIAQPRVRLARDLGGELSGEPRLADARLAREQDYLAGAGPGLAQAGAQYRTLRRPADEVGEPAAHRLEPALCCCGDAFDREGFDRGVEPFQRLQAEVAQPEQIADQAAGGAGEDDLPGLRQNLQARGEVGGLADHRLLLRRALADQIADDDKSGGDADADGERLPPTGLQARHRRCYFQPGPHRALGVVLMRPGIAEIGQHPVTHVLGDKAVIARDDGGNRVLVGSDLVAQFLGVEPHRQGRRADEIAEHHRQLPPLRLRRRRRGRHFGNSFGNRCGGQFGDGIAQAQPMACARHANVFQHLIIDLDEQVSVNVVGFEGVGILGETNCLEPIPYCAHAASSSRSAFASFRSGVSKPSVNQP